MCKLRKCDFNLVFISMWQNTVPTLDNTATLTGGINAQF